MRKLAFVLLILIAIPVVHYFIYQGTVVRPAALAALNAVSGVDLVAEFGKKVSVDTLLGDVRALPGNAAQDYQKAIEDQTANEEELPLVESGAERQECLFTTVLFAIPENLAEMQIPSLLTLRKFGQMMIGKSRQMEDSGDPDGAERELQRVMSMGNHLESEYTYISYVVGITIQKEAAEAMNGFYGRQNRPDPATESAAYAAEMSRLIDTGKKYVQKLAGLTASDEGRKILKEFCNSPRVARGMKAEVIFSNSINHLFYHTGILYGPGSGPRALREDLMMLPDPVLREMADHSQYLLDMNIRQRIQSMQYAEVIK